MHKVIAKPSQSKSVLANASWNIFSTLWSMAAVFFLTPFLIHRIGEANYGFYILLASVSGFLGVMNLGLGEATLRYVAYYYSRKDYSGINRVMGATVFVYALMGILSSMAVFFSAERIINLLNLSEIENSLGVELLRVTCITFFIRFFAGPFLAIPQAILRYDITARITVFESIFRVIGSIGVIYIGMGLYGLILWNLVVAVFLLAGILFISKSLISNLRLFSFPSLHGLKEIFSYGIFSFLSQVVGIAWQYADRMLLGFFIGTSAIAYFAVPQELTLRFLGLASSAGAVLMPKFSTIKQKQPLCSLYLQSTSILLIFTIIIFVPVATLFKDFMKLWVSPEFAEQSAFIGTILAASCMIRGSFIPYEALFRGMGKPQYYLVVIILSSSTILIADLILIPAFGLLGAGYAFCISPIWGLLTILFVYRKILKISHLTNLFKLILIPMIIGFICLGAAFWFRSLFPSEIGWTEFVFIGASIFGFTSLILICYNLTLEAEDNPIYFLISYTKNTTFGKKIWSWL